MQLIARAVLHVSGDQIARLEADGVDDDPTAHLPRLLLQLHPLPTKEGTITWLRARGQVYSNALTAFHSVFES
jgi:hypothetical protein